MSEGKAKIEESMEIVNMTCKGCARTIENELRKFDDIDFSVNFNDRSVMVSYSPEDPSFSLKTIRKTALDRVEKEVISHVLKKTGWNRSKATKILKISYKTLLYKISDLGIVPPTKSE